MTVPGPPGRDSSPAEPAGHAVVVGAGIGGLAAAVALHRVGWRVTVLERAPALGEVGAGLSLWSNALRALDALGVGGAIRDAGQLQGEGGIRTRTGRWLTRAPIDEVADRYGLTVLMVHRAALHRQLRAALPDAVRLGAEVTGLEQNGEHAIVHFRDGAGEQVLSGDLVVAADGVDSVVRAQLWPDSAASAYAGFTAWRGVTARAVDPAPSAGLSWGRGSEFGAIPMVDGRVYWFGTANLPSGTCFPDEHAEVRRRFAGWHAPVPALIDLTPPEAVLHHDIRELARPLPRFVCGRVALLGDVAHAMTPNLGQGACQALEDAVVLAHELGTQPGITAALAEYDAQRRPRSQAVARASRRLSRVIQLESPLALLCRNAMLRVAPPRVSLSAARHVTDWNPPPLPSPAR